MSDTVLSATGKRARSKAANRSAILSAARAVFARIGYDATTVRDIIRETELAAGTFYNYFKSKEEVFEAIASDSTERFGEILARVREESTSFEDYIRAGYRAYFQFLHDENCDAIECNAPHIALIGVRVDTPEMQAVFNEIRSDLEVAILRGEARHVDIEYLTAATVGIAREVGDHMLQRRPVDVDGATEFATDMLLAGVRALLEKAG
ncbi:MAG: TetR/AcrR family transcriptional regulator [Pseudomonadota bacterium]